MIDKELLKQHSTFCPHLWQHFSTDPNSTVKFCCEAQSMETDDFDLSKQSISNVFNNSRYNEVRKNNLDGIRTDECKACWKKEDSGLTSKRQMDIGAIDDPLVYNNIVDWSNKKNIIPTYYNLQVSKTCNQACIMCDPFYSSLIESINNRTDSRIAEYFNFTRWKDKKPFEGLDRNLKFWNDLTEIDSNLTRLYVTGGEPFIIKELWKYIESLVTRGLSKNIKFWCNTNFSNVTKKQLDLLSTFKEVEINLSIDAFGETNEYLRYASNWNTINNNISTLMPYLNDKFSVTIVPVIHALNIVDFDKLIKWWKKIHNETVCKINPIILTRPESMFINSLPEKYLEELKEKIQKETIGVQCENFDNIYRAIDTHSFNEETNKQLKNELKFFTHAMKKDYLKKFNYVFDI